MKIEIKSDYIKVNEDVKHGDIVQLQNEGEYRTIKIRGETRETLQFKILLSNGEEKKYTMNKTTQRNLIQGFGDDSKKWIGKDLKVWVRTQEAFGEEIDVLILTPLDWEKATKKGEAPIVGEEEEEREPEIREEDQEFP